MHKVRGMTIYSFVNQIYDFHTTNSHGLTCLKKKGILMGHF